MSDMKVSAPDWCFYTDIMEPEEYYDRLRHMGVAAAEMVAPERMDAARAAGLEIVNIGAPGMVEGLNRVENHPTLVPEILNAIAQAKARGIPHVIVFSGNRDGQDDAVGVENVARGLEQVLPDAEAAGVVFTFEMLNGYDHPDYQADRMHYGLELLARLPSPSLKLLYDIYHMARTREDIYTQPIEQLDAIAHFHVADIPDRSLPVELGNIDYRKIVHAARDAGYAGYWGLEFIPRAPVMQELEEATALLLSFGA